jgi:E3 ubiquitin-protein ligase HECTD4
VDEQLLQHFGKILGLGLRSGIPLPLDLVPTFWKSLLGDPLDDEDLAAFDPIAHSYVEKITIIEDESTFNQFLEENQFPRFTYPSFRGDLCDLAENGSEIYLSFEKRKQYVDLVRDFRFGEMSCQSRMLNVRAGLATIAPINILTRLFKPEEVELKICGQHKIDIEVLKKHTIYQVGLTQSDQHIKVNS